MPRPQHPDADEELQALFQEVVLDQVQAVEAAHPDERVLIFFGKPLGPPGPGRWGRGCPPRLAGL